MTFESDVPDMGSASTSQMTLFAAPPTGAEVEEYNFRLLGDRQLAPTWRQRAADNLAAIRLMLTIEAESRPATEKEQSLLVKFIGFGASEIANGIFPQRDSQKKAEYLKIGKALEGTVSPSDMASLAQATQYAHFTPEFIVRAMWKGMRRVGFTGGAVLEPGCGSGLFLALAPEGIAARSSFLGVERDPITARIAKLLYPESDIWQQDFTKAALPPGFDLAIGNPPFSSVKVHSKDPAGKLDLSLHNYFIARSIERLRPGGIAAFVVSRYMMDAADKAGRSYIAGMADLLTAIRLPEAAMRERSGTDVVVDLLFFRKRLPGEPSNGTAWVDASKHAIIAPEGKTFGLNEYWATHADMVLGTHAITSSQFGPAYTCKAGSMPLDILLTDAIRSLPEGIYRPGDTKHAGFDTIMDGPRVQVGTAAEGARVKEGSYLILNDKLCQIVNGGAVQIEVKAGRGTTGIFASHAKLIRAMIPVRDAIRDVLAAQQADEPWQDAQAALHVAYDAFVRAHGPINLTTVSERIDTRTGGMKEYFRRPNLAVFDDDPDGPLVASIENYDVETGEATKGPIFSQRVISAPPEISISVPADALAVVLNQLGRVDMVRIGELIGKTEAEAAAALGGTVYLNPKTEQWETADAYLSGLVRIKLVEARDAAKRDPRFERNVTALEDAQPTDILPSEISAFLGTPWIPQDVVETFCAEVIGIPARVAHTPEIGAWSVQMEPFARAAVARTEWGTQRRHAGQILLDALSNSAPKIYDTVRDPDGGKRQVLNERATQAAKDKFDKIREAFSGWVWKNADRSDRLSALYNQTYNDLVPRVFNGDHLVLPGASPIITFRRHQNRVVWRIITTGNSYMAHTVGSGKTLATIAAVMEQKRLGMVDKPMIVVPAHTLAQWSKEFMLLYPNANILIADEDHFAKDQRQRFLARAATGRWDAIIITHTAFKFIPAPADFEREMIATQLETYEKILKATDTDDRISIKKIERLKEGLLSRLEALTARKDDLMHIGDVGIDQIIVDEAQGFRKLSFATSMSELKGISADGSQMAWDLYVKSKYVGTKNPGRNIILMSGTPITNTMGELYSLLRFMNEPGLVDRNIQHFDAWCSTFCMTKTELELQPSGSYKPVERLSQFVNIPELTMLLHEIADMVLADDLQQYVKLPTIAGGKRKLLTFRGSRAFKDNQKVLAARIKAFEDRSGPPEKGMDIIPVIINDGRHMAIDTRMINPQKALRDILHTTAEDMDLRYIREGYDNDNGNKLNGLIDNVFRIWKETSDLTYNNPVTGEPYSLPGAAQMIFSDLGTLSSEETRGFSAYRWIERRLIGLGIPPEQIAFIQNYKKTQQKQRLFTDVNSGKVRILIGSSETMGTGVNAQQRLIALHHLDVPWLPSQIEQREGRIWRQGNQNAEIQIYAYATLGSTDATMWQIVERKMRFIDAVLRGDRSVRTLEDLDEGQADQFAMAKAMASGDDRLMRKAGLEAEIARLQRQRSAHNDSQSMVRREISYAKDRIGRALEMLTAISADIKTRAIPDKEAFTMKVGDVEFTDRKEAGKALMQAVNTATLEAKEARWIIAEYSGFQLEAHCWETSIAKMTGMIFYIHMIRDGGAKTRLFQNDLSTGEGIISRAEDVLNGLEGDAAEERRIIEAANRTIVDYTPRIGGEFDLQPVLDEKIAAWAELEADLAKTATAEKAAA